ncbi:hypothetical protein MMC31_001431, partial [Peltigera leucophlebia]|nr:hypothetical protein [Peltigera leucophlebia]
MDSDREDDLFHGLRYNRTIRADPAVKVVDEDKEPQYEYLWDWALQYVNRKLSTSSPTVGTRIPQHEQYN